MKEIHENCDDQSNFFIQVACEIPQKTTQKRQCCGLFLACVGVIIYSYSILYFDYIRAIEKNKFIEFDVNTITAGDYTIEFDMNRDAYKYFKKVYFNEACPMSEIAQFR